MRVALILRTMIVVAWLTALVWHGGLSVSVLVLSLALAVVWAAALMRDGRRTRDRQPVAVPAPAVRRA